LTLNLPEETRIEGSADEDHAFHSGWRFAII